MGVVNNKIALMGLEANTAGIMTSVASMTGVVEELQESVETLETNSVTWAQAHGSVGRNLLKNTASSSSASDVTYTVNSDGSVSTSGIASAAVNIKVCDFYLPGGKYHISGCPGTGSASTYSLEVAWKYPGGSYAYTHDYGNGLDINATGTIQIIINCTIRSGQDSSGLVFKPMITVEGLKGIPFEAYQENEAFARLKGAAAGAADFAAFKTAIAAL